MSLLTVSIFGQGNRPSWPFAAAKPGNPISVMVIAELYVKPLARRLQGVREDSILPIVKMILTTGLTSPAGKEEWIPVRLKRTTGALEAEPIFFKSNLIFPQAAADGLLKISADETVKIANT